MGYYEDHLNAVADRWKTKYQESGLPIGQFLERMEEVLTGYGWTREEVERIKRMVQR